MPIRETSNGSVPSHLLFLRRDVLITLPVGRDYDFWTRPELSLNRSILLLALAHRLERLVEDAGSTSLAL